MTWWKQYLTVRSSGTGSTGQCFPRGRTTSWTHWDLPQSCRSPSVGCVGSFHQWWDHLWPTPPLSYLKDVILWRLLHTDSTGSGRMKWVQCVEETDKRCKSTDFLFLCATTHVSTHRCCRAARVWSGWRWSERCLAAAGGGTACQWKLGNKTRPASASWFLHSQSTAAALNGSAQGHLEKPTGRNMTTSWAILYSKVQL